MDSKNRQTAFTGRLIDEIRAISPLVHGPIETIFIGGGTPTLLEPNLWQQLLHALHHALPLADDIEFTVEANPETVTSELMDVLVAGGVNRLSIGAQSFDPRKLKTLERWHDPVNVGEAMRLARAAGIDNINLDLIHSVPDQTLEQWREELDAALGHQPTHLSCYALTYEPNTPLTVKLQAGQVDRVSEETETAMFELTIDHLTAAGFEHYEVSNFFRRHEAHPEVRHEGTKADLRCAHNLLYWLGANWLAFAPSAPGHIDGVRWKNVPHLGNYLNTSGGAPILDVERLDDDARLGEQLMMRLRLIEGVELTWLSPRLNAEREARIAELTERGLLERTPTHLRLTRRGLMLADSVVMELL